jgi:predicted ABC-type transport system involved in lysophospholipase L1 biosynthesis ATPase subunit
MFGGILMYEKAGIVVFVNTSKSTARVMFEDLDNLISGELQIVGTTLPAIGDYVFCSFTQQKKGFILGPIAGGD